jgi:putative ABC transport system permease protein
MTIGQDFRYAVRTLRRNRGFAAVTILTLALGIGANTAMFSVIYAVLLRPFSYHDPSRLALLIQTSPDDSRQPMLLPDFEILKSQSRSFSDLAVYYKNTGFSRVTLTGIDEPESVQGGYVSANLFALLGVSPLIGRSFTPQEDAQRERVVVLSHALWQRRFSSERDIGGRTLEIDGIRFQVIGVMRADFQYPARETQFWAPISTNRYWLDRPVKGTNGRGYYARWNAVARLERGVSFERAQAEMNLLARRLEQRDPDFNRGSGLAAIPLQVELRGNTRLALVILFAAVSFVLLISCANAAHLMLARGASRDREMAVRIALGAGRADLIRQLLAESMALSLLAGCFGLLLAEFGVRALVAYGPRDLPRLEQAGLDTGVLAFAFAISFIAAILCGLVPAWKISRVRPNQSLKSSERGSSGALALSRTRGLLVVMEFALTVVLLTGAGLLIRSFLAVQAIDPGFEPEHILTLRVTLAAGVRNAGLYEQALERIRTIPGVLADGAINGVFDLTAIGSGPAVASQPRTNGGRLRVWASWKSLRGDYLGAMGVPLLRGRQFSPQDGPDAPLVAIIDQTMARRYWPNEDAIGKQFRGQDARGRNDDPLTVIGVIRDTRDHGREAAPTPHVYQPIAQSGTATPDLVVRTVGEPVKLAAAVRDAVRSLDRAAIVSGITTMEQQLSDQISPRQFQTGLLSLFSLVALALASVGIYGVMHYAVTQRTHEIGIRMALGAQPGSILRMVLRQGLALALPGLVAGLVGAQWLARLFAGILFGIQPTDPATYADVAMVLLGVAVAAVSIPAWRGARVDPLEALRQE